MPFQLRVNGAPVDVADGAGSLLLRLHRGWSTVVAIVGLVGMAITGEMVDSTSSISIGGSVLAGSEWLRLYAILGSVVGVLLVLVDLAALHEPDVPGLIVLGLLLIPFGVLLRRRRHGNAAPKPLAGRSPRFSRPPRAGGRST